MRAQQQSRKKLRWNACSGNHDRQIKSAIRGTIFGAMRSVQTSVTSLKTGAARLLRVLNQNRTPVVITQSGQPKGVLLDFESYEELKEAVLLLKLLAQSEEDIRTGRTVPQRQAFSAARARLSDR